MADSEASEMSTEERDRERIAALVRLDDLRAVADKTTEALLARELQRLRERVEQSDKLAQERWGFLDRETQKPFRRIEALEASVARIIEAVPSAGEPAPVVTVPEGGAAEPTKDVGELERSGENALERRFDEMVVGRTIHNVADPSRLGSDLGVWCSPEWWANLRRFLSRPTVPGEAARGDAERILTGIVGYGERCGWDLSLLDWACAECRPDSHMLKEGFQCWRHEAVAFVAAQKDSAPQQGSKTAGEADEPARDADDESRAPVSSGGPAVESVPAPRGDAEKEAKTLEADAGALDWTWKNGKVPTVAEMDFYARDFRRAAALLRSLPEMPEAQPCPRCVAAGDSAYYDAWTAILKLCREFGLPEPYAQQGASNLECVLAFIRSRCTPPAAQPAMGGDGERERRELLCEKCGCEHGAWSADSDLWNRTLRRDGVDEFSFLCPTCFMALAKARGVASHFIVTIERPGSNRGDCERAATRLENACGRKAESRTEYALVSTADAFGAARLLRAPVQPEGGKGEPVAAPVEGMSAGDASTLVARFRAAVIAYVRAYAHEQDARLRDANEVEEKVLRAIMAAPQPLPTLTALEELCKRDAELGSFARTLNRTDAHNTDAHVPAEWLRALRDYLASVSAPVAVAQTETSESVVERVAKNLEGFRPKLWAEVVWQRRIADALTECGLSGTEGMSDLDADRLMDRYDEASERVMSAGEDDQFDDELQKLRFQVVRTLTGKRPSALTSAPREQEGERIEGFLPNWDTLNERGEQRTRGPYAEFHYAKGTDERTHWTPAVLLLPLATQEARTPGGDVE